MVDSKRFDEMAYALVYGNLAHKDLPFEVVKNWIEYVINGKPIEIPFIMEVLQEHGECDEPV